MSLYELKTGFAVRHKFISILLALGQKKMSLKSDQLEVSDGVSFSIYII